MLDGVLHFASELPALAKRARLARRPAISTALEGYLSLGYFLVAGDDLPRRLQAASGALAARRRRRLETRRYWDVTEFDTDQPADESLLRTRSTMRLRTAVHDRLESEVPLGAFLSAAASTRGSSSRTWPTRSAIGWSPTSVGFGEVGAQRARAAGADGGALPQPPPCRDAEPRAGRGARAGRRRISASRWPTRPRFPPGTSRAARGACHGGADAATAATRRLRATTSATCRMRSRRRRGPSMPGAPGRAPARWLGARGRDREACRSRCAPARCSRTSARDSGHRLLRGPVLPETGATRAPAGTRPATTRQTSPVYAASPSPIAAARRRDASAARRVRRPEGLHAERPAREGRPHEHGAQPRGPLSAARSPRRGTGVPHPVAPAPAGHDGKVLLRKLAARRLPAALVNLPRRASRCRLGTGSRAVTRRAIGTKSCHRPPGSETSSTSRASSDGSNSTGREPPITATPLGELGARALAVYAIRVNLAVGCHDLMRSFRIMMQSISTSSGKWSSWTGVRRLTTKPDVS